MFSTLQNLMIRFDFQQNNTAYLSITAAGEQRVEFLFMFAHGAHPITVAIQGSQERFGKHPLKFGGVQRSLVLTWALKRVQGWVVVSWNCGEENIGYFLMF